MIYLARRAIGVSRLCVALLMMASALTASEATEQPAVDAEQLRALLAQIDTLILQQDERLSALDEEIARTEVLSEQRRLEALVSKWTSVLDQLEGQKEQVQELIQALETQ